MPTSVTPDYLKSFSTSSNILHTLRSFNPIFTLSAVQPTTMKPKLGGGINLDALGQDVDNPDYIIAKSSGKGVTILDTDPSGGNPEASGGYGGIYGPLPSKTQSKIESGQYDFYFDNVEIHSVPAFSKKTTLSKATNISFNLIEPYGIGGLFQAMQVAANNAGAFNWKNAAFVLRIQFKGYPHDDDSAPITINEYGERYFPIIFTGIDVKADASGTTYHLKAAPLNELSFSNSNKLFSSLTAKGTTVGEVTKDLFDKINKHSEDQYKKSLGADTTKITEANYDTYEFVFTDITDQPAANFGTASAVSNNNAIYNYYTNPFAVTSPAPIQSPNSPASLAPTNKYRDAKVIWDQAKERHHKSFNLPNESVAGGSTTNPKFGVSKNAQTSVVVVTPATPAAKEVVTPPAKTAGLAASVPGSIKNITQSVITPTTINPTSPINQAIDQVANTNLITPSPPPSLATSAPATSAQDSKKTSPAAQDNSSAWSQDSGNIPSFPFQAGEQIHDCLSAILTHCDVIRQTIIDLDTTTSDGDMKGVDANGMVDWFYIQIQTIPKPNTTIDPVNGTSPSIIRYIIHPYKIHPSRIPGFESKIITQKDITNLKKRIRRTYNYIYTGKNLDILNFELKYNNLYYQTRLVNSGVNNNFSNLRGAKVEQSLLQDGGGKNFITYPNPSLADGSDPVQKKIDPHSISAQTHVGILPTLSSDKFILAAQQVHRALLEQVGMINIEFEIVGDPYYLIQGGIGNIVSSPDTKYIGITTKGDADHQSSDIYIQININNVKDIDQSTGFSIKSDYATFSGVYRVIKMTSNFSGGVFTQKLQAIRINSLKLDSTKISRYKSQSSPGPG